MLAVFLVIDVLLHLLCATLRRPLPPPHGTQVTSRPHTDNSKYVRHSNMCFVSAVDFNQLGFFLLANVFTGVVNFLIDTLNSSVELSVVILVLYMASLMTIFLVLHKLKVKIKL